MGSFKIEFDAQFSDPDKVAVALRKIKHIKQTKSVAEYFAELRPLVNTLGWNDAAILHTFHEGLKDDVKDVLVTLERNRIDTPDKLAGEAIRIDERLEERRKDKRSTQSFQPPSRRPQLHLLPALSMSRLPKPWYLHLLLWTCRQHVDALLIQERERRRQLGLCFYCGQKGHGTRDCPKKPKTRFGAATEQVSVDAVANRVVELLAQATSSHAPKSNNPFLRKSSTNAKVPEEGKKEDFPESS